MKSIQFTDAAFVRSHGKAPRGRGQWLFQMARSHTAFGAELTGPVRCFGGINSTLAEAKAAAKAEGLTGLWAVMP